MVRKHGTNEKRVGQLQFAASKLWSNCSDLPFWDTVDFEPFQLAVIHAQQCLARADGAGSWSNHRGQSASVVRWVEDKNIKVLLKWDTELAPAISAAIRPYRAELVAAVNVARDNAKSPYYAKRFECVLEALEVIPE